MKGKRTTVQDARNIVGSALILGLTGVLWVATTRSDPRAARPAADLVPIADLDATPQRTLLADEPAVDPASLPAAPGGAAPMRTSAEAAPNRRRLLLSCSPSAHRWIAARLERAFERKNPGLDLVLRIAPDRHCLDHMLMDSADVALVGVGLSRSERNQGLVPTVVAHRIMVPVVHLENPVQMVQHEQMRALLEGQLTDWAKLGWHNQSIQPVCATAAEPSDAAAALTQVRGAAENLAIRFASPSEILAYVANNPYTIGLVPLTAAQGVRSVRMLEVDRVPATREQFERGAWRFGATLRVVTRNEADEATRAFVAYLGSNQARLVIRRTLTLPN